MLNVPCFFSSLSSLALFYSDTSKAFALSGAIKKKKSQKPQLFISFSSKLSLCVNTDKQSQIFRTLSLSHSLNAFSVSHCCFFHVFLLLIHLVYTAIFNSLSLSIPKRKLEKIYPKKKEKKDRPISKLKDNSNNNYKGHYIFLRFSIFHGSCSHHNY